MQQSVYYTFPFEKIKQGELIIIYGAGQMGQCFLYRMIVSNYCTVVAVADKFALNYESSYVAVIDPEKIDCYAYDKILIAINDSEISKNVKKELIEKYHVPAEKIVSDYIKKIVVSDFSRVLSVRADEKSVCNQFQGISIAFLLSMGLGDIIIAKHIILGIMQHAKDNVCKVDLYVGSYQGKRYADSIFFDCTFVNQSFADYKCLQLPHGYDAVIDCGYVLQVLNIDYGKISKLDKDFEVFLSSLKNYCNNLSLDASHTPTLNSVHFARYKFLGYNCNTLYNDILQYDCHHIPIPLQKKYKESYELLQLNKYVTLNFGWGINPNGKTKIPSKVWPVRHYEKFVKLFHHCFPDLSVVQLGTDDSIHIKGVDWYIFGQSLELVKYILRGSLLHIDCEGGLVHLATNLGTKCCVLFGPTPVHYFGYEENINIVSEVCHNCYYLYDDFSACTRRLEEPECMASIMPERVVAEVVHYFQSVSKS